MTRLRDTQQATARHPIAVVTERTGLSQDLLRVWERRYGAVTPARSPGGQRLYSDADIERLTLLSSATRAGRSISHAARLSTPELAALVDEDIAARQRLPAVGIAASEVGDIVGDAMALTRALDSSSLDDMLRRSVATLGVSTFIESVAAPLLRRVGDEWHAGQLTVAQEHLVSSLLHDIVAESMRSFTKKNGALRLLVATPAGERHVIGAALVGAAAAVEGWNVLYLGADLPATEIADAAVSARVRLVAVSIVYVEHREAVIEEMQSLRSRLPSTIPLIAGGSGARAIAADLTATGIRVQPSVDGLLAELRRNRVAA
ncbi:MAG TPA: cobalamin-dependent protein [Gemmatimonadaceae bacterium]|nr:cobalamin-dependent protein [Gemmatimonadaceae bacterium]